jgi:hypothetical protein
MVMFKKIAVTISAVAFVMLAVAFSTGRADGSGNR